MADNPDNSSDRNSGVLHRIIRFITSIFFKSDSDGEDKHRLKVIANQLKNYSNYFKLKNQSALQALAEWFYAIYKIVGPAAHYLERCKKSELFVQDLVESYLPDEVKQLTAVLSSDSIELKRNSGPSVAEIVAEVQSSIDQFNSGFDLIDKREINKVYADFDKLLDFSRFQFSFLLTKFDSHFPESNYHYNPNFSAVNVNSIINELIEFIELFYNLGEDGEWDRVLQLCRQHYDKEIISQASWTMLMKSRRKIFHGKWLIYIVQYVNKDLQWKPRVYRNYEDIAEQYRSSITVKTESIIKMLMIQHENKLMREIEKTAFAGNSVIHNINYSNKRNKVLASKNISGYLHVLPLEYLRTFNQTEFQNTIRIIAELLILQGKWGSQRVSQQFSEAYMQLKENLNRIEKFDADLAPEGLLGKKINLLIRQYSYQMSVMGTLKNTIQSVNDEARNIIDNSLQALGLANECFSIFIEECDSHTAKVVKNWNELKLHGRESLSDEMKNIHQKTSALIELINLCLNSRSGDMLRSDTAGETPAEQAPSP